MELLDYDFMRRALVAAVLVGSDAAGDLVAFGEVALP